MRIGLIADTHSLVRPEVFRAFEGVERILHAGDVGGWAVLKELETIAPVEAVHGTTDPPDDPSLTAEIRVEIEGRRIHVSHGHELGSPTPGKLLERYDADILVYGHTHKPLVHEAGPRLVVNPGAAGPRRFNLQPSVAILEVSRNDVRVSIIQL
jgi:putative phosphoesterase